MSDQVCKWCGDPILGKVYETGGWAVCSEKCRQQLAVGGTQIRRNTNSVGCMAVLAVIVYLGLMINSFFKDSGSSHSPAPAQTQQGFDHAPKARHSEPVEEPAEETAGAPDPVEEATPEVDSSDPNVVEPAPKPKEEPVEPVEPVAQ